MMYYTFVLGIQSTDSIRLRTRSGRLKDHSGAARITAVRSRHWYAPHGKLLTVRLSLDRPRINDL